jgi:uncharacterized protein YecE (DUF72 family)
VVFPRARRNFLTNIDRENFIFVWGPRGEWSGNVIAALFEALDLVPCVDHLECKATYGKLKYCRLHGPRDYRHQYRDDELARLRELSNGEAYMLFNKITMYDDALRFKQLIQSGREFFYAHDYT